MLATSQNNKHQLYHIYQYNTIYVSTGSLIFFLTGKMLHFLVLVVLWSGENLFWIILKIKQLPKIWVWITNIAVFIHFNSYSPAPGQSSFNQLSNKLTHALSAGEPTAVPAGWVRSWSGRVPLQLCVSVRWGGRKQRVAAAADCNVRAQQPRREPAWRSQILRGLRGGWERRPGRLRQHEDRHGAVRRWPGEWLGMNKM